ncbi:MAG: clostripain-related cysteine peptidase [Nocardioides sp.]
MTLRRPGRRPLVSAVCLTLALSIAGCSSDSGADPDDDGGSTSGAEHTGREGDGWTFLHYSMADTNLEPFMVQDVNELGQVGSNDNLHVRELIDRSAEYGDDELLDQGSWVGARVLDLGEPGTTELVEDLGDVDSADPDLLARFIAEGIEANRAGHYALVISDHGASWPGIGPDEGSDFDVLDLAELTAGIRTGLDLAGVDKLDLIGFDACLMSSYEVASAMAPLADRMVASQELEPGHGWNYASLQVLADDPDTTADELGSEIIAGFVGQAEESGTQDEITLSLVDLTKMDAVDAALAEFAEALVGSADTIAPVVGRAETTTLGFAKSPNEAEDGHLKDLGLLASTIGVEALQVSDQADALVRAINDAVVEEVEGVATKGATGLSIYFPPRPDLADGAYSDVVSAQPWNDFLAAYYDVGAAIPEEAQPQFLNRRGEAEVTFDNDGSITLTGTYDDLAQGNLTEATISYAFVNDDDSVTYFGEEIASFDDTGTPIAEGNYDLTSLVISDGVDEAFAYLDLDLSDDLSTAFIDVPMTYYAADDVDGVDPQDVLLSVVLDVESGDIVSETLYVFDPDSGGYGELAADPEGILVPDVLTLTAAGEQLWEPTSDVGLYADLANLTYDVVPLDPGTVLQVDLSVFDFGGNSSTVSSYVEVP